jgi:hypothetical protein
MAKWMIVIALAAVLFAPHGIAQSQDQLVGTWKLLSGTDTSDKGEVKDAYGPNPTGFLNYSADGRMIVIITYGGRKPLSVYDSISAPAAERAEAFSTMVAYAGRYTVTGDKVVHHVEAAWLQNRVGQDLVRYVVKLEDGRLVLRTPPFLKGGTQVTTVLVWERTK